MNRDVWSFTGNNHAKSCKLPVAQNTDLGDRKHTHSKRKLIAIGVRRYVWTCLEKLF